MQRFQTFCLAGISTFHHFLTSIFFYAIREILYTYNLIYWHFTLGWQISNKIL